MKIGIIGGGTAGFVSALILKQTYPSYSITMIKSEKIGTIGVGEGTTEHWKDFIEYVGITNGDLISKCDATYKAGIMFENWGNEPYLQTVEGNFTEKYNEIAFLYAYLASLNVKPKDMVLPVSWSSKVAPLPNIPDNIENSPTAQYHFNTNKLNEFLSEFAKTKDIEIIDDKITDIEYDEDTIISLQGRKKYNFDFYIDCTGFSRLLIGKLGAKWQSYNDYLKMNKAIVFPTDNEDYPMWTLARAMNAGWMFRIPVYGRKGNGYIFDSNYITDEEAKAEVEEYLGHSVEVAKTITFDPGKLDRAWIGNCCAIGLSCNFVEPLEASSIGTSIQQSFMLANQIANYKDASIKKYNKEVDALMENIRDFIILHYMTGREDTEFWKDIAEMELPESLTDKIDMWMYRIPTDSDCVDGTDKVLFKSINWFLVLYGLGFVDYLAIKDQFDSLPKNIQEQAQNTIQEWQRHIANLKLVDHKKIIDLIRDFV